MQMKIGVFGGAFNPPHKMHKQIAIDLLNKKYLDKIIYVPVADNYNKPNILKGTDRLNMLKLMFLNTDLQDDILKNIGISSFEVDGSLYTINTLNYFKNYYPDDDIFFICGTDNLNSFRSWNSYEEILNKYKLMVISRENYSFDRIIKQFGDLSKNIVLAPIKSDIVSSTLIRNEIIKNGYTEELNKYLDIEVINYLKKIDVEKYWK